LETNLYMQNQLLHDTDVMSMCHGLEVRVPFLDDEFQRALNTISPRLRFDKRSPKKLLTDSFGDILPKAIWDRPKMGFSFPLQQWMQKHEQIIDEGLYKNKEARKIIARFKNDQLHWSKAFALYQVSLNV
jgi:asparagine synthase (glutamine-hydrolysing)